MFHAQVRPKPFLSQSCDESLVRVIRSRHKKDGVDLRRVARRAGCDWAAASERGRPVEWRPLLHSDVNKGPRSRPPQSTILPQASSFFSSAPRNCDLDDTNRMQPSRGSRQTCTSSTRVTAGMLLSFLALSAHVAADSVPAIDPWYPIAAPREANTHEFSLRHIFHRGTYQDPDLHKRFDLHPDTELLVAAGGQQIPTLQKPQRLKTRSNIDQIERLVDRDPFTIEKHLEHAYWSGFPAPLAADQWTLDEVQGPNITDRDTIVNLAVMAADAYADVPGEGDWQDVSQGYNRSQGFGWQGDGLRGYVFADEGNKTIIIALKGTSPAVFDGDGTSTKDKLNDNLFFSCCCAQGGQYFWRQVCDCTSNTYTCNSTCVVKALHEKNRYYGSAIDLYTNVTELYADSNVWLVGHSLGGAVTALLGLTFGLPTVTFEAPGDDLAAKRLGLPTPPSSDPHKPRTKYTGAYHFGNTADPVFMGSCNGATATCTLGGYAMESQCHTGKQCVYDVVTDFGWRVGIGNHKIHNVIDNVIMKYDQVAECVPDDECRDCYKWKYFESNGSHTTTTSSTSTSTKTRTRTNTCKTPGWWGCLDETTTTTSTVPVITTTYTTTSCATPGWFGCNKEVNVTVTTTTVAPTLSVPVTSDPELSSTSTGTTTCETPGWFGCLDHTTTASPSHTSAPTSASKTASTHTCETPGLFFGCRDRITHSHEISSITSAPSEGPTGAPLSSSVATATKSHDGKRRRKCKHPAFFGLICLDSEDSDEWAGEL